MVNVCIYRARGVVAGEGCEEIFLIIATSRALISAFVPDALAMHLCLRHTSTNSCLPPLHPISTNLTCSSDEHHTSTTSPLMRNTTSDITHVSSPNPSHHDKEQDAKLSVVRLLGRLPRWLSNARQREDSRSRQPSYSFCESPFTSQARW